MIQQTFLLQQARFALENLLSKGTPAEKLKQRWGQKFVRREAARHLFMVGGLLGLTGVLA
jgi:hypothetical protein